MNNEIYEIMEYLKDNYKEDYIEILTVLMGVYEKINQDIKKCVDERNYGKVNELSGWAEKINQIDFGNIIIEKNVNSVLHHAETQKENTYCFDGIELSLADVWTGYIPVQFEFDGLSEKVFGIWKNLFVGVLRELFRRDYKKFERMVLNNAVKGRQYPLFSQKDIGKEYSQIPNTGYFYRSHGLSPEQMRTYLHRIFDYFEISSDKLKVYVDADRKRKSKITKKNGTVKYETAYIVEQEVIKNKKCPLCNKLMEKYQLKVYSGDKPQPSELYSMMCSNCNKVYVSDKVYRPYIKGNIPEQLDIVFKKL